MANYIFGEIKGVNEGDIFRDRQELRDKGVQLQTVWGIDGNKTEGCPSIVLNGGYIDDLDLGNEIIYTGHGGNKDGKQIADQSWEDRGNKALLISELHGKPVRVTRGHAHKSIYSPSKGYIYGGLYIVTNHFEDIGKHGFKICRYRLEKITNNYLETPSLKNLSNGNENIIRTGVTTLRIVRDTKLSREIKELYDYKCQVCNIVIEVNGVRYAEAAHIKPLGKPHNGYDTPDNLLCLCPNHHVMFDKGIFGIRPDYSLIGINGKLNLIHDHKPHPDNLIYHSTHIMIN